MEESSTMPIRRAVLGLLGFCVPALLAGLAPARAAEDYVINVILPMSGNAAFVGHAHEEALHVLETLVNRDGGIGGHKLKLVIHDDQTSPQVAVQITNDVLATRPAVMLGSSIVAMCSAEQALLRNGPFTYCLSPGMHPAAGSYMYSIGVNTQALIQVIFTYFREKGWTRIATITSTDATGQEIEQGFDAALKLPENAGIHIAERTRFTIGDVSTTAQIERIKAANPQVVIAWSTGGAIAGIFKGLLQAGLDVPVVTTNGNMVNAVMAQFADFLPKTLLVASPTYVPHDGAFKLDPRVEAQQARFYAIAAETRLPVDYMAAGVWDPLLMLADALRQLGPQANAAQVRDWLAGQTAWAGINGLYDFTRTPQRGLDSKDGMVSQWDAAGARWVPVSLPGGKPIN
jgi:branched-chain amino acid transport system substrate-binding protein